MSMELIDSNKLIDYFFYGIDEKPITGSTETDEKVIQVIQSQPTVKAIPLEKLEQIRSEIESKLQGVNYTLDVLVKDDALIPTMKTAKTTLEDVLEIIDKALKEQLN